MPIIKTKVNIYDIDADGILYKLQHHPYFTFIELQELKSSVDLTLKRYKELNLNDEIIEQLNQEECKKEMQQYAMQNNFEIPIKHETTFVYLMLDKNTGYHKIGRSINPNKRERTLQSEKPTITLFYHCEVPVKIETILHEKYKDYRVRGEWFDLDEEQINEIVEYLESKRIVCQGGTTK